jgi:hypothetical protein
MFESPLGWEPEIGPRGLDKAVNLSEGEIVLVTLIRATTTNPATGVS